MLEYEAEKRPTIKDIMKSGYYDEIDRSRLMAPDDPEGQESQERPVAAGSSQAS